MADQARRTQEQAQKASHPAQEQTHGVLNKLQQHKPTGSQVLGFLTFLVTGGIFLLGGGLALTAAVIALIVLSPVFIFLSPVLIPAGFLLSLLAAGTLTTGGISIATLSAISWLYNYFKGRRPPGSDQVDNARSHIHDAAAHMHDKARHLAGLLQGKAEGGAQGA